VSSEIGYMSGGMKTSVCERIARSSSTGVTMCYVTPVVCNKLYQADFILEQKASKIVTIS